MLENIQPQTNVKSSGFEGYAILRSDTIIIRVTKEVSVARMEVSEQHATRPLNYH
jgi:hypothetical protein